MSLGSERQRRQGVPDGQRRQPYLSVFQFAVGVVGTFDVGAQEAGKGDHPATGPELGVLSGRGDASQPDHHALAHGVSHLGGHRPHPHQLVEATLVAVQAGFGRRAEGVTGGADGLVGLLGVLDLLVVAPGPLGT